MGHRHQVISDMSVPEKDNLPEWFVSKYSGFIDFDRDYWASYGEAKRYCYLISLDSDVQKVVIELNLKEIRLVYFADEGLADSPDIIHVTITQGSIVELRPSLWEITDHNAV